MASSRRLGEVAFELLGAAALLWPPTRRAAGIGLFMLTLAVTPVHVFMLQRHELFDIALWVLILRLPLQLPLLALVAWSTGIRKKWNDWRRGTGNRCELEANSYAQLANCGRAGM